MYVVDRMRAGVETLWHFMLYMLKRSRSPFGQAGPVALPALFCTLATGYYETLAHGLALASGVAPGQAKRPAQEVETVRAQRTVRPVQQPLPVGCKARDVRAVRARGHGG